MKVNRVEVFDIHCPDRPAWTPVFVRIHTDEGISGVGEAGLAYDLGHSAAAAMIKEMADAFLIGHDPFQTEKLWSRMLRESFWGLGGGPVVPACFFSFSSLCCFDLAALILFLSSCLILIFSCSAASS